MITDVFLSLKLAEMSFCCFVCEAAASHGGRGTQKGVLLANWMRNTDED